MPSYMLHHCIAPTRPVSVTFGHICDVHAQQPPLGMPVDAPVHELHQALLRLHDECLHNTHAARLTTARQTRLKASGTPSWYTSPPQTWDAMSRQHVSPPEVPRLKSTRPPYPSPPSQNFRIDRLLKTSNTYTIVYSHLHALGRMAS